MPSLAGLTGRLRRRYLEHRVARIQAFGRQQAFETLNVSVRGRAAADPHERRPLLGPQVWLNGQEFAERQRVELQASGSTNAAITRSPTAVSGIAYTAASVTSG